MNIPPQIPTPSEISTAQPVIQAQPKTSGLAITSLICGVFSLLLSILTGIPAIICGHIALSKIKKSQGSISGNGMAITGLVLGYISIPLIVVIAALAAMATPVILKQQQRAKTITASSNAKQIFYALVEYDSKNKRYPETLTQLQEENYIIDLEDLNPEKNNAWRYFSGQSTLSPSDNILLASPEPFGDKHVILRNDGSISQLLSADYQAAILAQEQP